MADHFSRDDAAQLPSPPLDLLDGCSLFLDFDGTLVAIASTPDAVEVAPRLNALLDRLDDMLQGRLVLLSGRSLAQLDALLGAAMRRAGGSHGLERRPVLSTGPMPPPAWPDWLAAELAGLTERFPDVLIEEKSFGLALHYRRDPTAEEPCRALAERIASAAAMAVQPGKKVFEVRPTGHDKGTALRSFMDESGFRGHPPLMIGDDLTDEPAFAAAAELGGSGVLVGAFRPTAARYRLSDDAAVLEWLTAAVT